MSSSRQCFLNERRSSLDHKISSNGKPASSTSVGVAVVQFPCVLLIMRAYAVDVALHGGLEEEEPEDDLAHRGQLEAHDRHEYDEAEAAIGVVHETEVLHDHGGTEAERELEAAEQVPKEHDIQPEHDR